MTTYRRHPDLRLAALDGEGVVLHLGARRYFTVSETGLVLLEALEKPCTIEELVSALTATYDVDRAHAETSVHAFLDRCREGGLLVRDDATA
jgi:hypothetical protein